MAFNGPTYFRRTEQIGPDWACARVDQQTMLVASARNPGHLVPRGHEPSHRGRAQDAGGTCHKHPHFQASPRLTTNTRHSA
jgi:hypothetical protein